MRFVAEALGILDAWIESVLPTSKPQGRVRQYHPRRCRSILQVDTPPNEIGTVMRYPSRPIKCLGCRLREGFQ